MNKLSVVIAVYNEGNPLIKLCERIVSSVQDTFDDYEIILVDDRSKDNSWNVIRDLCLQNHKIKGIRFIRNFGQHAALSAGIENSKGNYIVLMDCDQQDEPENIPTLFSTLIEKDVDLVYALRQNRKDKASKVLVSKLINLILEKLSGFKHNPEIGTFRIFTYKVREALLALPEKKRYLAGLFNWMGFRYETVPVEHKPRFKGQSNYTIKKQLKLARLAILSGSTKLLSISTYVGFISSLLAVIIGGYYFYLKLFYNVPIGFTSIIISILLICGIILLVLGIIGEYLREIVDEIKARPNFLIEEILNPTK